MDLGNTAVAVGTLALAAGTGWLAFATHRMSKRAVEELEISRAALDRAHRPVIVPASGAPPAVGLMAFWIDAD